MNMTKCNHCQKEVSEMAVLCPHCGNSFLNNKLAYMGWTLAAVSVLFAAVVAVLFIFVVPVKTEKHFFSADEKITLWHLLTK